MVHECMHKYGIQKMVPKNLFGGQQWRKRHREQTQGHRERRGEGETYGESNMETDITVCKTDSQWECAVGLRELKRALYQPRGVGWEKKREGSSRASGHMYTYG